MPEVELSVVVPARNEAATVGTLLARVIAAVPPGAEIVVVDDGSTDDTWRIVSEIARQEPAVRPVHRDASGGKGMALRTGIALTRGALVVFQDADLELDPAVYPALLAPLRARAADAVYGSRFLGARPDAPRATILANRVLTVLTNLLFGTRLTDMETGHKAFRGELLRNLPLAARTYDIEPEVTALLAKHGARIVEVPTTYRPRGRSEGKRIGLRDGWLAVKTLVRQRLVR